MTFSIEATFSAEDNALRLYPSSRFDSDTLKTVKDAGFKWAPKQGLFVAHRWTPEREDLCLELAGEITAEQSTIVERAEAKAERLDDLAAKRSRQADSFFNAAERISERFYGGQPILIGHHSERKARNDQKKMHAQMDKSVKARKAVDYWAYRAEGVERHANRKSCPRVRANRIKRLLKGLRDQQRYINHAYICVNLWTKVSEIQEPEQFKKAVEHYAGGSIATGSTCRFGAWSELTNGELDHREFVTDLIPQWEKATQSEHAFRWMSHILNRLSYERSELGDVFKYEGEFTAVILQAFAREHGAHKPKATKTDGQWKLESSVPLPAHVADGCAIELDADGWRDLMQSCGYSVPVKKERRKSTRVSVPLINPSLEEAERLQKIWNDNAQLKHSAKYPGQQMTFNSVSATVQARYSANSKGSYTPYKTIELNEIGARVWSNYKGKTSDPICRIRLFTSGDGSLYAPSSIVVIEDKPSKALPIDWDKASQEADE